MEYDKLCNEVERLMGCKLKTSKDFEALAERVCQRTGVRLSHTTFKRIWGYITDEVQPRESTLDVLARYVGFASYESFIDSKKEIESNPIIARSITDEDLALNQRLVIMWQPNRRCVVRHKEKGFFQVEEAENTKLSVGDTFRCHLMIEREPLYVSELVHYGKPAGCYVAGRNNGIIFDLL